MTSLLSLKKRLEKEKLDGLFVSKPENVSYLSGFKGGESYLLITQKKNFFITDSRYAEQAKKETKGFKIESGSIVELIKKNKLKRCGFEAKHITYGEVSKIRDRLTSEEFLPTYDLVEDLRVIKTVDEINKIKKAIAVCLAALDSLKGNIKPGDSEARLAAYIEYQMKLAGALRASFDIIVLSGANASMPHGWPSARLIKKNEAVFIDAGALVNGYNSDLTRAYFIGKPPVKIRKIYDIVKRAQELAIKAVRPGAAASEIDRIARNYIKKQGFGDYFGHAVGHGVGREVHEAPSISPKSKAILKPGMVFTVEPAIYVPGLGGIRLEEMVLVTEKGKQVISQ